MLGGSVGLCTALQSGGRKAGGPGQPLCRHLRGHAPSPVPSPGSVSGPQPSHSGGGVRCARAGPAFWMSPSPARACLPQRPQRPHSGEGGDGNSVLLPHPGPWAPGAPGGPASGSARLLALGGVRSSSSPVAPIPQGLPATWVTRIVLQPAAPQASCCSLLGVPRCVPHACQHSAPSSSTMDRPQKRRAVCAPPAALLPVSCLLQLCVQGMSYLRAPAGTLGPECVWAKEGGLSQGLFQAQGWVVEGEASSVLGSLLPVASPTQLRRPPA